MFLKNTSNSCSVVIHTVRGNVGIKPQEIVDIQYKILPPVSASLKEVSAEEYITFLEKREGTMETLVKAEEITAQQTAPLAPQQKLSELARTEDEVLEENNSVMDFVNSLFTKEDTETLKQAEALVVNETDSTSERQALEQQIEDLKNNWKLTRASREKEKIAKEIKELQKQLKQLQNES